jgi:hypothetical protein
MNDKKYEVMNGKKYDVMDDKKYEDEVTYER